MSEKNTNANSLMLNKSFPSKEKSKVFIVDSTHPYNGSKAYCLEVLEDVAGLVITDELLDSDGADYPVEMTTGIITYGKFSNIGVSEGLIKLYII